jgi:hypothetical protein
LRYQGTLLLSLLSCVQHTIPTSLGPHLRLPDHTLPLQDVQQASNWKDWARTTSSRGTVCLRPLTLVIVTSVVVGLVCLALLHQPRLDKSAQGEFPRHGRLGLQNCQQFLELIHREAEPLRRVP